MTSVVVGGSILVGNTGHRVEAPLVDAPAWVYKEPPVMTLTPGQQRQLLTTSLRFVQTAVTRKDVDDAYDMVAPSLRQGMTRREWHTGNIPVVPFEAVGLLAWTVAYSYTGDVALDLSLVADKRADTVGKTFRIELKRYRGHWLVESWVPQGISGANNVRSVRRALANQPEPKAPLGAAWLVLPFAVFAAALMIPIGLGIHNWRVGRRAAKRYEAELRGDQ